MGSSETFVHPSAVVHPRAELAEGVRVGPGCVIGEHVRIGRGTVLESHVTVAGVVEIGEENRFSPFIALGGEPQDIGYKGDPTRVRIGDRNVFREFITVHRGTVKGGGLTEVGHRNFLMAYSHIAHDNKVGSDVIFTNGVTLAGHVTVGDFAVLGAFTGVHQFCRIGRFAFTGGFTVLTQDLPPFLKVAGMRPPRIYGVNGVGLRRRGFDRNRVEAIRKMIRLLVFSDLKTSDALARIEAEFPAGPDRDELLEFARSSRRGILKKTAAGAWENDSES